MTLYKSLLRDRTPLLILLIVLGFGSALAEGLGLSIIYPLINAVVGGEQLSGKFWDIITSFAASISGGSVAAGLLYLTVVVFLLKAMLLCSQTAVAALFTARLREDWAVKVLNNYLYGPFDLLVKERRGKIMQRVHGETGRASKGVEQLIQLFIQAIFAIVMIAALILINWKIMIALTCPILITALILHNIFLRPMYQLGKRRMEASQELMSAASEPIFGAEVVKLLGAERTFIDRLRLPLRKLARETVITSLVNKAPGSFIEFIVALAVTITFAGVAIWMTIDMTEAIKLTAPVVGTFAIISARLLTVVSSLVSKRLSLSSVIPSLTVVQETVNRKVMDRDTDAGATFDRISGDIVLSNINFSYDSKRQVFRDSSLTIPSGKIVALVGPSGIGKSTLGYLLARLYDPDSGTISINGRDITDFSIASLRDQIGYVEQSPTIFNGTVEENIRLGAPGATQEQIVEAAQAAGAHDFIEAFPDGYKTIVQDQGASLSGGQRQRLAIARAIIRRPSLFIIDEGTSALDHKAEAAIHRAIRRLVSNTTVLFITHRLTTLEHADLIYELGQEGRVTQRKLEDVA